MDEEMATSAARIRVIEIKPQLEQIIKTCGMTGATIGILHHGQILHRTSIGFSNIETRRRSHPSMIYGIGSLTKAFIAAGIAVLVEEGRMEWTTPIKDLLPGFRPADHYLYDHATVIDLLAHRTGLSFAASEAFQGDGASLLPYSQILPCANALKPVRSLREEWLYNSWGYSIAGLIIEQLSGKPVHAFLNDTFFEPLGLNKTSLRPDFERLGNAVTNPHAALSDGTPILLKYRQQFTDNVFEAAGGIFSNVDDLLMWSRFWLGCGPKDTTFPSSQRPHLLSAQILIGQPSHLEKSYALGGWIRTQLPGSIGFMGDNPYILDEESMPIVGRDLPPQLIYYHQGSTVGYFSNIALIPTTQSAIVVLTNGIGLADAADWLGQAVLQALLEPTAQPIDYLDWSERTVAKLHGHYEEMTQQIREEREPGTQPRGLWQYLGRYFNDLRNFYVEIVPRGLSTLMLSFQGQNFQWYELRHLHDDTFEWSMSFDEMARRGRYHVLDPDFYKFKFSTLR